MKYLCYLVFLTLMQAAGSNIEGTVTDSRSKGPLMGANIMLYGTMLGAASDENGYYIIKNIPIGTYNLRAMFIGYEAYEKEVKIEADAKYVVDINLKESAIEIQETKVTGEKRKEKITGAPASMEIVSSRDIKGKTTTNMGAYLKGLKGIDFTSSGINNYSISVRGFNSSFNTRLLTLSDGRVANIPALRVINYSTLPQSMDDVDKIEVILGPATALYGANAHSGVVNIISKPPAQSEGFSMSISGSSDERQLRKINGRIAQKLSNTISIKLSGLYLHAYDWPFISEDEYKFHLYPWTLTPYAVVDGKDNNPWNTRGGLLDSLYSEVTEKWYIVGNGEKMDTGDPDGDGVMGEDWYNGYDDDGDGLIDEDYFTANQIDDNNNSDDFLDLNNNGLPDPNEPGVNSDGKIYSDGIDNDNDGLTDEYIDENIDGGHDLTADGVDNDHNGVIDDESGGSIEIGGKAWGSNIESNILIEFGRKDSLIHGEINPYYVPNIPNTDLLGKHRFNQKAVKLEFDIFTYDYGPDGLAGDPFTDEAGDDEFQLGECLSWSGLFVPSCDCGLDGICPGDENYLNPDIGEDDNLWQPGEGWNDNGDGIVDWATDSYTCPCGEIDGSCAPYSDECDYGDDVWPPKNGVWDIGEAIFDWGHDGLENTGDAGENNGEWAKDGYRGDPFVDRNGNGKYDQVIEFEEGEVYFDLNNNGKYDGPTGEYDGIFDTGDDLWGVEKGEPIINDNGNGILDPNEEYADYGLDGLPNTGDPGEGDGQYNAPDLLDNYKVVLDNNGDGLSDYPDFEIDNRKVELRLDFDPHPDFNMTFQSGYSWTKTQQVTGTGRYLADGFEYKFYQIRSRYKNWFSQFYMNQSFSGNTRGYNLGNRIIDKSKNYAYQLQHNFDTPAINTKLVWGLDYFRTEPYTYGTILNDGPNGYDNDGDFIFLSQNQVDDDGDGVVDDYKTCADGGSPGFRDGRLWNCYEGVDEPDEFIDPTSNEYGVYYQSTTELFGTSRYELITAARLDYHDILDEGVLFAPKLGFIFRPDSRSSMRFTYGKAYNTPNSISLFTDLFVGKRGIAGIYLRGNYDGTDYCRVGLPCLGENYPTSVATPGFYAEDDSTFYTFGPSSNITYFDDYAERVQGAPYFFKFNDDTDPFLVGDNIPLDTMQNLIYVPELNGDGLLYTALESIDILDVDPIRTEKIQTLEFGYKGFLGNKTHFSLDYYLSYYEDFFSPPTIITPLVVKRMFDKDKNDITHTLHVDSLLVQGIMTINDAATYPPYATAFNGLDDNGDWEIWADEFGWDDDDENNDGKLEDPGEWGFVVFDYVDDAGNLIDTAFFHPWEVMQNKDGFPVHTLTGAGSYIHNRNALGYLTVGVDEWSEKFGLNEHEIVEGALAPDGTPIEGVGVTAAPYHLVLSPMNYGEVWMQGLDVGFTHFLSDKLIIDGNVSWYGTTKFYNELTKKNDPINAPKWKWNTNLKWKSTLGDFIINYRHVNQFDWSDGIWTGIIGPYDIIDLFYTYYITENLDVNLSALNLNNDIHKELIGGAQMGRQMVIRFTSSF